MSAAGTHASPPSDYAAALSSVAYRYRGAGVLSVGGADRVAFLQGQLTQDVRGLAAEQSLPAAGLSPKGKLIYFGRVLALPERLLLLVPATLRLTVLAHLAKYAAFQKVALADESVEFVLVGLYGPGASAIEPPEGAVRLPAEGEFSAGLLTPASAQPELDRALLAVGSTAVSDATAEILRVEAGRPRFGSDADESNLPAEVGLEAAISTTKGCYVGQEVVARLRTYGRVKRRLVGFRFPGELVPAGTVFPDPEKPAHELGRVTSVAQSPRFGSIGLGFAFRDVPLGGALHAEGSQHRLAVVAPLPFA